MLVGVHVSGEKSKHVASRGSSDLKRDLQDRRCRELVDKIFAYEMKSDMSYCIHDLRCRVWHFFLNRFYPVYNLITWCVELLSRTRRANASNDLVYRETWNKSLEIVHIEVVHIVVVTVEPNLFECPVQHSFDGR